MNRRRTPLPPSIPQRCQRLRDLVDRGVAAGPSHTTVRGRRWVELLDHPRAPWTQHRFPPRTTPRPTRPHQAATAMAGPGPGGRYRTATGRRSMSHDSVRSLYATDTYRAKDACTCRRLPVSEGGLVDSSTAIAPIATPFDTAISRRRGIEHLYVMTDYAPHHARGKPSQANIARDLCRRRRSGHRAGDGRLRT